MFERDDPGAAAGGVERRTEGAVERLQPRLDVVEPPADAGGLVAFEDRSELATQESGVAPERGQILHRPVVEVVREPDQPALHRRGQRTFALRAPLELQVALEQRLEHARRLTEVGRDTRTG